MRPSTWFVTILLVAAMFTALACSASGLGNPPSPIGDSVSATVDPTITNNSAPPEEAPEVAPVAATVEAKPSEGRPADADSNEILEPRNK